MRAFLLLLFTTLATAYPPHPEVLRVRQQESHLPRHLQSPALHNPRTRDILELTSQLHDGEQIVYERHADKIPRIEIYKILTHAGLAPRARPVHQHHQRQYFQLVPRIHYGNFGAILDDPFYSSPDLLQHL